MSLYWLGNDPGTEFPPLEQALTEPNGLLAAGGDLSYQRLVAAYQRGIFPWYNEGQPILWWSPDPRMVLQPGAFHCSRSLSRSARRQPWRYTINESFDEVMARCAAPRVEQDGTWITPHMRYAYSDLHRRGWAHSVEVRLGEQLVGGIYGVAIDRVFFGESMFSSVTDTSKLALRHLCMLLVRDNFRLIDCQMHTAHLASLGATLIPRREFSEILARECASQNRWQPARAS